MKFTNEAQWTTRDDDEIATDLELIAVDVQRVVQKWQDGLPAETRILEPGEKFPDLEALNAEVPQSEWVEGPDGKLRGPWQAQHILYLLDPGTMDKYTFPTGTVGGRIAVGELRDKLIWMRRTRGPNVYPVVTLSDTHMRTRFGGRQRPHFKIVRWVRLGGEGGEVGAHRQHRRRHHRHSRSHRWFRNRRSPKRWTTRFLISEMRKRRRPRGSR